MKHKKAILASIVVLLSSVYFTSCKEDNVYRAIVTVSMIDSTIQEARTPVPNCQLIFGEDHFAEDIKRTVYTDNFGRYEGEWPREVSLRIQASKEINGIKFTGASVVRLKKEGAGEVEILIK